MPLLRSLVAALLVLSLSGAALAGREKGEPESKGAPAKIVVVRAQVDGRAVRKVYQVKPLVDADGKAVADLAVAR